MKLSYWFRKHTIAATCEKFVTILFESIPWWSTDCYGEGGREVGRVREERMVDCEGSVRVKRGSVGRIVGSY